jgi:hypothetical protein
MITRRQFLFLTILGFMIGFHCIFLFSDATIFLSYYFSTMALFNGEQRKFSPLLFDTFYSPFALSDDFSFIIYFIARLFFAFFIRFLFYPFASIIQFKVSFFLMLFQHFFYHLNAWVESILFSHFVFNNLHLPCQQIFSI